MMNVPRMSGFQLVAKTRPSGAFEICCFCATSWNAGVSMSDMRT